jgi:dihydrofolate reductase
MGRLIVSNMMSLDGFIAGPEGELDWFVHDGFLKGTEFGQYARGMMTSADAIILGRLTYEEFAGYWPTATDNDPVITERMNGLPKVVLSRTLDKVGWGRWDNARLVKENVAEEVKRMKQDTTKDIVILGSGTLVSTFTKLGLIDEYQIVLQPIILGKGKPHFKGLDDRYSLKLLTAKPFGTGAVLLYYQPNR